MKGDIQLTYEIVLKGQLSSTMETYFEPMHIAKIDVAYTRLVGIIPDQAVLFGLLSRIRDLNIELIELRQVKISETN